MREGHKLKSWMLIRIHCINLLYVFNNGRDIVIWVKKELVSLSEVLLEHYNWIVREYGPSNHEEEKLKKVVSDANIGEVFFNEEGIASIKYRTHVCRDDV